MSGPSRTSLLKMAWVSTSKVTAMGSPPGSRASMRVPKTRNQPPCPGTDREVTSSRGALEGDLGDLGHGEIDVAIGHVRAGDLILDGEAERAGLVEDADQLVVGDEGEEGAEVPRSAGIFLDEAAGDGEVAPDGGEVDVDDVGGLADLLRSLELELIDQLLPIAAVEVDGGGDDDGHRGAHEEQRHEVRPGDDAPAEASAKRGQWAVLGWPPCGEL